MPRIFLAVNVVLVFFCVIWLISRITVLQHDKNMSNSLSEVGSSPIRDELSHHMRKSAASSRQELRRFLDIETSNSVKSNSPDSLALHEHISSHSNMRSASSFSSSSIGISRPKQIFGAKPTYSTLKIFGVGLSFSGSNKLVRFFSHLGLRVLPFDVQATAYLPHAGNYSWEGVYDDVDVVLDLPVALYYNQLLEAYPQALFIATSRDVHLWFDLISEYLKTHESLFTPADFPLNIRMLHKLAFGSDHPDKDVWISNYQKHYQQVREAIPSTKLLKIHFEGLTPKLPVAELCRFIQLSDRDCASVSSVVGDGAPRKGISNGGGGGGDSDRNSPRTESVPTGMEVQQAHDTLETVGFQSQQSVHEMLTSTVRSSKPAKHQYAYVTYIDLPVSNKVTFDVSALVKPLLWCQSVRHASTTNASSSSGSTDVTVLDYDVVGLLASTPNATVRHKLHSCFDRLLVNISALTLTPSNLHNPVVEHRYATGESDSNHEEVDEDDAVADSGRFKVWTFALIEYKRVQFFDTANGALVLKDMDAYFFRNDLSSTRDESSTTSASSSSGSGTGRVFRPFYAPYSALSPISTHYFSVRPSIQTLVDLMELYLIDRWEPQSGWMGYGAFGFAPRESYLLLTGAVADEASSTDDEVDAAEADEGEDGVTESVASSEDLGEGDRIRHLKEELSTDNANSRDTVNEDPGLQRQLSSHGLSILRTRPDTHANPSKKVHGNVVTGVALKDYVDTKSLEALFSYSNQRREALSRLAARQWRTADWTFDGAWSDTGMLFYYFFLLTADANSAGILNAKTIEKYLLDSSALVSCLFSYSSFTIKIDECS